MHIGPINESLRGTWCRSTNREPSRFRDKQTVPCCTSFAYYLLARFITWTSQLFYYDKILRYPTLGTMISPTVSTPDTRLDPRISALSAIYPDPSYTIHPYTAIYVHRIQSSRWNYVMLIVESRQSSPTISPVTTPCIFYFVCTYAQFIQQMLFQRRVYQQKELICVLLYHQTAYTAISPLQKVIKS